MRITTSSAYHCLLRTPTLIFGFLLLHLSVAGQVTPPRAPINVQTPARANETDVQKLNSRVAKLESDAKKNSAFWRNPIVIAAIVAGFLALLGQYLTARRALEQAKQEALFQQTEKILEFRLKQLELFYAPMFALLEQSKALYIKLNGELVKAAPDKFTELEKPDAEGYRFKVKGSDGRDYGFRLLDRLPEVRAYPEAFALVKRVIQIGEQLTKIVSEHAGLASHQTVKMDDGTTKSMVALLGEYCAHYAILSSVYEREEETPYPPGWHKVGYYPRSLNKAIEDGYKEIQEFVTKYANESEHMLKKPQ